MTKTCFPIWQKFHVFVENNKFCWEKVLTQGICVLYKYFLNYLFLYIDLTLTVSDPKSSGIFKFLLKKIYPANPVLNSWKSGY